MTKLYHFFDPRDIQYARASGGRTLACDAGEPCPECGVSRVKYKPPFMLEWETGSEVVGDFTFPGYGRSIIITDRVRISFEPQFRGFEINPIIFWQNPKLQKPTRITKRTHPRIWLPYSGPTLWELWITKWCRLDLEKSGVALDKICSTCGREIYIHQTSTNPHWVLDTRTWAGEDLFHLFEMRRWFFCSESIKSFIEQSGFSNIKFNEYGIIPE
jgi:hypothetical protein